MEEIELTSYCPLKGSQSRLRFPWRYKHENWEI